LRVTLALRQGLDLRSEGNDSRATASGNFDEAFLLEQGHRAVGSTDGDRVRDGELGKGGQLVTGLEAA
jgi:hypothetical protein